MPCLSDCRFDSLRAQGFTGATSDMLLQWLQANGAASPSVPDAWKEMLLAQTGLPAENYHRMDYWRTFLINLGAPMTDSMNDLEQWFWCDLGGIIDPNLPKIVDQPIQQCFDEGTPMTWTVVATSGDGSPLTYQWQEFVAGVWTNLVDAPPIAGALTATLTLNPAIYPDDNGRRFRCVVSNAAGSITSQAVTTCFLNIRFVIITEDEDDVLTEDTSENMITEDSP